MVFGRTNVPHSCVYIVILHSMSYFKMGLLVKGHVIKEPMMIDEFLDNSTGSSGASGGQEKQTHKQTLINFSKVISLSLIGWMV